MAPRLTVFKLNLSPVFFMVLGLCLSLSRHDIHISNGAGLNPTDMT